MDRDAIRALALAHGFKLKPQPDGTEDLNPYVYDFAVALMATALDQDLLTEVGQRAIYLAAKYSGEALTLQEQIKRQPTIIDLSDALNLIDEYPERPETGMLNAYRLLQARVARQPR